MVTASDHIVVSVILIARNEEATIGPAITAVREETTDLRSEIILVDSASTDGTADAAATHRARVITLEQGPHLSPAAGRYVGTKESRGEYLLFLDGDMLPCRGFIRTALSILADPTIAGVAGRLYWVYPGEELHLNSPDHLPLGDVPCLGGAGLYRRSALEQAGTFNPWMRGEEERELGYRITRSGFRLRRIEVPMAHHLAKRRTKAEIDEKATYYKGVGQILREYPMKSVSTQLLWDQRSMMSWLTILLLLPTGTLILAGLGAWPATAAVAATGLLGLGVLLAIRGYSRLFLFLRSVFLAGVNIFRGMGEGIPEATRFDRSVRTMERPGADLR